MRFAICIWTPLGGKPRGLTDCRISDRGPLHGIPLGVKEVFDVAGMRCAWGSPIHSERIPGADCEIVSRLRSAGAVVVGITASTEYAMARAPADS